mmetsp:Transcript_5316/g.12790  ORF Transcript_5316/g.12790 Transcript_5316/m.12790 type:complete len:278 (+) Transcript_5316:52-885(+)
MPRLWSSQRHRAMQVSMVCLLATVLDLFALFDGTQRFVSSCFTGGSWISHGRCLQHSCMKAKSADVASTHRPGRGFGKPQPKKSSAGKRLETAEAKLSVEAVIFEDFNEALNLTAQGDHSGAIPLYQRALRMIKDHGGDKTKGRKDYGRICTNLARSYDSLGDSAKAKQALEKALKCFSSTVGEGHEMYAFALQNLAAVEVNLCDFPQAEVLFKRALSIYRNDLSQYHVQYCATLQRMAMFYSALGEQQLAAQCTVEEQRVATLAARNAPAAPVLDI